MKELTKEMGPKEARSKREEEVRQLQSIMDQNFEEASSNLQKAKADQDMDLYGRGGAKKSKMPTSNGLT